MSAMQLLQYIVSHANPPDPHSNFSPGSQLSCFEQSLMRQTHRITDSSRSSELVHLRDAIAMAGLTRQSLSLPITLVWGGTDLCLHLVSRLFKRMRGAVSVRLEIDHPPRSSRYLRYRNSILEKQLVHVSASRDMRSPSMVRVCRSFNSLTLSTR